MRKRTGLLLLGGGVIVALGIAIGAALLVAGADEPAAPEARTVESVIDPYRQWGIESGDLPATGVAVATPPNAPMEYAPLDAAYLASLTSPAEGRLIGTVESVEAGRGAVIRADLLEVIDPTGASPVVRALPSAVSVAVAFGDAADPEKVRSLSKGDVLSATIRLEPGSGAGRIVIQSFESAP